jgi:hypothetical protein
MLPDVPRRSLPVAIDVLPTLTRARKQLGGRAASHGRAGEVVRIDRALGVVLCSDARGCDVWVGGRTTRRVSLRAVEAAAAPDDPELAGVAADARAFARLEEGQRVVFDGTVSGRLIEKCRFGGLVARDDGRIFAVGFRRFARPDAS